MLPISCLGNPVTDVSGIVVPCTAGIAAPVTPDGLITLSPVPVESSVFTCVGFPVFLSSLVLLSAAATAGVETVAPGVVARSVEARSPNLMFCKISRVMTNPVKFGRIG